MGEDYQRRQREKITEALKRTDVVICTALIPGPPGAGAADRGDGRRHWRRARSSSISRSRPGGNVEGSRPGETVTTANGVKIIGHLNMPSRIAVDASQLYARNLLAFLGLLVDKDGRLAIDAERRDRQGDPADPRRRGGQPGAAARRPRRRRPASVPNN